MVLVTHNYVTILLFLLPYLSRTTGLGELIYAVNSGGEAHIDVYGIRYEKDPLTDKIGTASDFGKNLVIGRVPPGDQVLYQTERYHHSTFGYDIPLKGDGEYVLVLKFSEVYFNAPDQKVFDVVLNGEHTVIPALDIYGRVGRGVAYDEYIPFTVMGNALISAGQESTIKGGKVKVEFVKGYKDNPKVNAVLVIKGRLDDVPKLPPLPREEDLDNDMEESRSASSSQNNNQNNNNNNNNNKQQSTAKRRPSGPRTPDPYASDDTSSMLPIFVAIGAAVPILFCLCKL